MWSPAIHTVTAPLALIALVHILPSHTAWCGCRQGHGIAVGVIMDQSFAVTAAACFTPQASARLSMFKVGFTKLLLCMAVIVVLQSTGLKKLGTLLAT